MGISSPRVFEYPLGSRCLAEFTGAYFLVLVTSCTVLHGTLQHALSIGATIMALMFTLGPISGGHFNPAVTASVLFARHYRGDHPDAMQDEWFYMPAQFVGGIVGGISAMWHLKHTFDLAPVGRYHWGTAGVLEAIYTSALCYVFLSATRDSAKGRNIPCVAVGFTATAASFAINGVSGCFLNPAISLGTALVHAISTGIGALKFLPLYFAASFIGSFVAARFFLSTFPEDAYMYDESARPLVS
jgi:glycerol uptake facilitator-like aquaporin